jgi:hypothetical protein
MELSGNPTELYQQMLRDAQKVEDPRLVSILKERLRLRASSERMDRGHVIPFPGMPALAAVPDEADFWDERVFSKSLFEPMIFFGVIGTWLLLVFYRLPW